MFTAKEKQGLINRKGEATEKEKGFCVFWPGV